MEKYDIFISYRRDGGYDTAKHLYDLLTKDGYRVSFDIDTLRNGDFDTSLLKRIDQCKDFILIVDAHAFDRTLDPDVDPSNDWLRQELAYALKTNKNIIPIFLNGAQGFPSNLPEDIVGVVKKNGPQYNQYYFNDFYKVLKKRFLVSKKGNRKGIIIVLAITLCSIAAISYSIPREGEATPLCVTIYAILWIASFLALIVGLVNPKLLLLNNRGYASIYILPFFLSVGAFGCGINEENIQDPNLMPYLTARQMEIYFGNPKEIVIKRPNEADVKTEFDLDGKVRTISFRNTKLKYNWEGENKIVVLSYINDEFRNSYPIEIDEFTPLEYVYTVSGAIDFRVCYRDNGSIQEMSMKNPESETKWIYDYESDSDMFPVTVTQKMGDNTMIIQIIIDEFDPAGNPVKFTEKCWGNEIETTQVIKYY